MKAQEDPYTSLARGAGHGTKDSWSFWPTEAEGAIALRRALHRPEEKASFDLGETALVSLRYLWEGGSLPANMTDGSLDSARRPLLFYRRISSAAFQPELTRSLAFPVRHGYVDGPRIEEQL